MKTSITIEPWEWAIFTAQPRGFEYIEVSIREPSQAIDIKASILLKDAVAFGNRLIALTENMKKASK